MGATLGHLVVYNFNITQNELTCWWSSIDYNCDHPVKKASADNTKDKLLATIKTWNKTDVIVTVISIPCVTEPIICVQQNDTNLITHDDKYTATTILMDDPGRYFKDMSYDEQFEPYVKEINIDGRCYNTANFVNITGRDNVIIYINKRTYEFNVDKLVQNEKKTNADEMQKYQDNLKTEIFHTGEKILECEKNDVIAVILSNGKLTILLCEDNVIKVDNQRPEIINKTPTTSELSFAFSELFYNDRITFNDLKNVNIFADVFLYNYTYLTHEH